MRFAGIDLGSRMIKLVVIDETGRIAEAREAPTAFDPLGQSRTLLEGLEYDVLQATGYGRHLFRQAHGVQVVSEILAHAIGAACLVPAARAVLDIGGQDTKAIALGEGGKVVKFEMNDRCAAGTGKFLEVMALAFGVRIEDFSAFAAQGLDPATISSMCTVFAESEATALVAKGAAPADIALGLHLSMARRAAAMVKRVCRGGPLVFSGGVARNTCMVELIRQEMCVPVIVPDQPNLVGAYGAALLLRGALYERSG
jgi:predicted CoA-substrate-specific enzyme activase